MVGATDATIRQRFVLDSSVALSWCFPDENDREAQNFLVTLRRGTGVVPMLWFLEVSNSLLSGERRGRLTPSQTDEALQTLGSLSIQTDDRSGPPFAADVLDLARKHNLTTYDAAYLELALRLSLPLATLDRSLRKAAKKAGIRIYGGK